MANAASKHYPAYTGSAVTPPAKLVGVPAFADAQACFNPSYHLYFVSGNQILIPSDASADLVQRLIADGKRTGTAVVNNGVVIVPAH